MNFWRSIKGQIVVELTSADATGAMIALNECGIPIEKAESVDEMTVRLTIGRNHLAAVRTLAAKRGEKLTVHSRKGLFWAAAAWKRRPVLLVSVLLLLSLTLILPTRVLFVRVEGNESVPERQILAAAESCGIRFGASRREVRSEKVKNNLLGCVPQLQWAGVNTAGCVATISVRERADTPVESTSTEVSSLVAVRDGLVLSATVTAGNGQCEPGQVVREGQVLISGYTDCGLLIRATRAEGEVIAQTRRKLSAVTVSQTVQRTDIRSQSKSYSLILGKKRINFWNNSRICDTTCGRMYEEIYITLPGGFVLPVALAVETHICYETERREKLPEDAEEALSKFAREYVCGQMVSGTILEESAAFSTRDGMYWLDADYLCREMIGRRRQEGKVNTNGKSD